MRFDVVTLFPELFTPHLALGVTRRAFESGAVDVRLWQLREHALDVYRRVDDRPYGGGEGMVLLAEPLIRAVEAVQRDRQSCQQLPIIHFTPTGKCLDQSMIAELAQGEGAILICGRYEGIDQRFIDAYVTHEISLGDFVLSGGELPALALLDAVARLQEGVITSDSHERDSFSDGLLEGPCYSRPESLQTNSRTVSVPPVLLSGHHGKIKQWRRERAIELTANRRPDLLAKARSDGLLSSDDEALLAALLSGVGL